MRRGTKIGWLLVAVSLILSVWVISSQSTSAETLEGGFEVSDSDSSVLTGYSGAGGALTIPGTITSINAGAFANNSSITSVVVPDSVVSIGSGAFQGDSNLQSVTLGNGITSIASNLFRECTSLSSVNIPSGVTSIGSAAFYQTPISSISIPAATTSISLDAFGQAKNLTAINVAGGNSAYSSSGGCLYNASGSRLLLVPEGKTSVSIAAGTTTIASGAFSDCTNISSLTVPDSVTTIESNAFTGSGIASITIPATTTSIGSQSGWTPSTIYGYANSAAETYAMDNNIPFIVVGENATDDSDDSESGGSTDNGSTDNGSSGGSGSGETPVDENGNPIPPAVDENGNPIPMVDANGNPIPQGSSASGVANGTANGAGGHTLDNTPTTADGVDTRYFLCIAIFAGGVGVIMYSRFSKFKYLSDKKK
ncbi:MAG: leucine-rich repeat domain-containing protein [Lachnospiraceae bacterium]|nr:leucine-rich repeat domain-containing protein [Lachnospiraceae bacterium]